MVMIQFARADVSNPRVHLETSLGNIVLELDPQAAPKTVENFLRYVRDGFYNGTVFHRVIKGFMIQGGGLTADMQRKPTHEPISNEADNGLKNNRGTVAMARTNRPHSATSQFFINTVDNGFLDHKNKSPRGWGYCVFGKVVEGMEVVDSIEGLPTTSKEGRKNVPISLPTINRAVVEKE
ncbi:MAG: peptidylprolyl isomerase [Thermodesulfobacteriota bacterium]|nr:peptidylprolyl isomerase [Thermodesulfobacteriota bacterium]